ncbi:MAG: SIMPL domain-containing protein [Zoogloeaceae bacterium]|nr:SIMPL domain-containing protein [Zoogloeaceae bacterium]
MYRLLSALFVALLLLLGPPAVAAENGAEITLQVSATAEAPNDWHVATLYAEATAPTLGEAQKNVQTQIAQGLALAKTFPTLKVQSAGSSTDSVLNDQGKPTAWRARADLSLETGDAAAFADAVGKLSRTLAIANLLSVPSEAARRQAETTAISEAMTRFRARAKLLAELLGRDWQIEKLDVFADGRMPVMRNRAMTMADAAPIPLEAGSSRIEARIGGTIRLSGTTK